jgi:hypothetical protein
LITAPASFIVFTCRNMSEDILGLRIPKSELQNVRCLFFDHVTSAVRKWSSAIQGFSSLEKKKTDYLTDCTMSMNAGAAPASPALDFLPSGHRCPTGGGFLGFPSQVVMNPWQAKVGEKMKQAAHRVRVSIFTILVGTKSFRTDLIRLESDWMPALPTVALWDLPPRPEGLCEWPDPEPPLAAMTKD